MEWFNPNRYELYKMKQTSIYRHDDTISDLIDECQTQFEADLLKDILEDGQFDLIQSGFSYGTRDIVKHLKKVI